eukprot:5563176-Amphidinium_carterae.5
MVIDGHHGAWETLRAAWDYLEALPYHVKEALKQTCWAWYDHMNDSHSNVETARAQHGQRAAIAEVTMVDPLH